MLAAAQFGHGAFMRHNVKSTAILQGFADGLLHNLGAGS